MSVELDPEAMEAGAAAEAKEDGRIFAALGRADKARYVNRFSDGLRAYLAALASQPVPAVVVTDAMVDAAAKAMHDGPLGGDDEAEYTSDEWNRPAEWCRDMARAALTAALTPATQAVPDMVENDDPHFVRGTCEDPRLKEAGYYVCSSHGVRDWHWKGADGKWHDGFKSESAAVNAALSALTTQGGAK